jgi:hypothetical protein
MYRSAVRLRSVRNRIVLAIGGIALALGGCSSSTSPGLGRVTLWVANVEQGGILGYAATQLASTTSEVPAVVLTTPSGVADGVAFDNSGNLWVAEPIVSTDSLACTPTGCTMRQASPVLGLVPWREYPTDSAGSQAWLLAIGTTPARMDSTTRLMRARHLVAVARDVAGDVRVVLAGGMRADGWRYSHAGEIRYV